MFTAPADLDTDQWVESCVAMGGTYGVFTAKHEGYPAAVNSFVHHPVYFLRVCL
jgi:hypothetical protein